MSKRYSGIILQQHIQAMSSELGDVHILPRSRPNLIASYPLATSVYY